MLLERPLNSLVCSYPVSSITCFKNGVLGLPLSGSHQVSDRRFSSQSQRIPHWFWVLVLLKYLNIFLPLLSVEFLTFSFNIKSVYFGFLGLQYSPSLCYAPHKTFYKWFPGVRTYSIWSENNFFVVLTFFMTKRSKKINR